MYRIIAWVVPSGHPRKLVLGGMYVLDRGVGAVNNESINQRHGGVENNPPPPPLHLPLANSSRMTSTTYIYINIYILYTKYVFFFLV